MASASGESLEKLEDMIVHAAESTSAHVRAAKGQKFVHSEPGDTMTNW